MRYPKEGMRIYFVRHATTDANQIGFFPSNDNPLNEQGIKEAEAVARRLESIPLEKIISSTLPRALQTAEAIRALKDIPLETNAAWREIERPSELVGKTRTDETAQSILRDIWSNLSDASWRHSDEENFPEFKHRVYEALLHLQDEAAQTILIVTHSIVLRMVFSLALFGEQVTPEMFIKIFHGIAKDHTGISILECNDGAWKILVWNDQRHIEGIQ